jgi:putative transposase
VTAMPDLTPERQWWTAREIADAALPDLPATQQGVEKLAKSDNWRATSHARQRAGRGGGWEYSWRLFPIRARRLLLREASAPVPEAPRPTQDRDTAWAWFERLKQKQKDRAAARLRILQMVEAMVQTGVQKSVAATLVGKSEKVPDRTIWSWFAMIDGVPAHDRLAYLAPRHTAGPKRRAKVHADPKFMDFLKSDYLRPAAPSFTSAYRRACAVALAADVSVVPEQTARRRLAAEVSKFTMVLAREGEDALRRYYPPQTRDKVSLRPLEIVNTDFHKFDVFVEWPREHGQNEPAYVGRPQMVAFQDVFSGRILSWRIDQTPNSVAVAMAAGDMIEAWGIPEHILMDNGREFAAKSLTGGAKTRYRFKVREDDVPGLFISLGCQIHWATPYSGQSKPIERAFRDMCDAIAKDPRFDGAYTGNRPDAKPEDYGSRAIPLEDFLRVLGEGIEEHNTRSNRKSEAAFGRSFAEAFDEAYQTTPIRIATEAQRRYWLLGAEGVRGETKTGMLRFQGNEYWADWMHEIAGESVIIRFDPADLWDAGLHVYSAENEYLGHAPIKGKKGFLDMAEARTHARARRDWMNKEKAALAAARKLKAVELGRALDAIAPPPASAPEAKVVRPVFGGPRPDPRALAAPEPSPDQDRIHAAVIADITARRAEQVVEEAPRQRFQRALQLERALSAGEDLTRDQRHWLADYQSTSEYRGERIVWSKFGDAIFG